MLVKTNTGKLGRTSKGEKGYIRVKVVILNENLHPLKNRYGDTVIEYYDARDLIYNPKIIIER